MLKALLTLLKQPDPPNAHLWHKHAPVFPVRLEDGGWSLGCGQIWRRRRNGRWVYRQDEETEDQWESRQW